MISHAQSGRMEEQRCPLQPSRSTPATPTHNGSALNNVPTGQKNTQVKHVILVSEMSQITLYCLQQVQKQMHSSISLPPVKHGV